MLVSSAYTYPPVPMFQWDAALYTDFEDNNLTSLDRLEGVDAGTFIDLGSTAQIIFSSDGGGSPYSTPDLDFTGASYFDDDMGILGGARIYFRDSGVFIESQSDGYIDVDADVGIRLNTLAITTEGTLQNRFKTLYPATLADTATPHVLTALECSDTLITNQGWASAADITFVLPEADTSAGDGLKVKFLIVVTSDTTEDIYIDTEGSTTNIYLNGVAVGDGQRVWSQEPAIGESISCHTATQDGTTYDWYCDSINGVWLDKGS